MASMHKADLKCFRPNSVDLSIWHWPTLFNTYKMPGWGWISDQKVGILIVNTLYAEKTKPHKHLSQTNPTQICERIRDFIKYYLCQKKETTHQKESVPNDPLTLMDSKSLLREQIIKLPDSWTASLGKFSNNWKGNIRKGMEWIIVISS